MSNASEQEDTFETTYPKHSFSELVRLSLIFGRWIGERRQAETDQDELEPSHRASFGRHT